MQLTKERLKSLSRRAGEMDADGWEDDAETIRALIAAYNAEAQEPVAEWVKNEHSNYPSLKWRRGYIAEIGAKLYDHPQLITDAARHLSNLLTRIHRDGGHYEDEHGTDKAVADADDKVAQLYAMIDAARGEAFAYKDAARRLRALLAKGERKMAALSDFEFGMFLRNVPKRLSDDESDKAALRKVCECLLAASAPTLGGSHESAGTKPIGVGTAVAQSQAADPKGLIEAIEALQCPETHSCSNPELFERGWEVGRGASLDVARALLTKGE